MGVPIGTTPTLSLTFSDETLDLTAANHVYVTIEGGGHTITKTDSELSVQEKKIDVYLSQQETLKFQTGNVRIQVNWTYGNGSRAASTIVSYNFGDNLLNRVVE